MKKLSLALLTLALTFITHQAANAQAYTFNPGAYNYNPNAYSLNKGAYSFNPGAYSGIKFTPVNAAQYFGAPQSFNPQPTNKFAAAQNLNQAIKMVNSAAAGHANSAATKLVQAQISQSMTSMNNKFNSIPAVNLNRNLIQPHIISASYKRMVQNDVRKSLLSK